MVEKTYSIVLGIALFVFGFFMCIRRVYHDFLYDYHYDFGPHHYLLGILFMVAGSIFIYTSIRKGRNNDREREENRGISK